ncbi:tubulin-specific chaperone C isoform X2 [Harmonia axyridis]|uniref:tubulin-specific chaperone C isoform X2 n=1 Tax=Harmonia axyridis TaxID=115357 RepID=UPI001E278E11|nr:tubulin-specific chaperone C isoform X2 [Harmonia axyridis]
MATKEQDKISLIFKRDIERKENIKKQKDIKELNCASNEKIDYFHEEFTMKCSEIENLLSLSSNISLGNLAEHFNVIFKNLSLLQKYVADSNLFLRSYDIKKCNDILHNLNEKTKELEDNLLPKKRFGFRNKSKLTNKTEENPLPSKDVTDFAVKSSIQLNDHNSIGFSNRSNEVLCLKESDIHKKNIDVSNSSNCTVKILGSPSTLHLNTLKSCTVLCGPVSTSIFASNCENCTLVIACQQFRLHSSKQLKIFLHVTSRAIIEDCSEIYIAPYKLKYAKIEEHFKESGLDISSNNWQSIDDFNWLKANEHSPNWSLMDENDTVEWTA